MVFNLNHFIMFYRNTSLAFYILEPASPHITALGAVRWWVYWIKHSNRYQCGLRDTVAAFIAAQQIFVSLI